MTRNGEPDAVRFEGFGAGDEILGGLQANFLVARPGEHAREVSVAVNDPGLEFLATTLGHEDSDAFRRDASRVVGDIWISRLVREGRHVDPVIFLSKARMEMAPGFTDEVRRSFEGAAPGPGAAGEASPAH
ncbi:MAG TPA: hypothetical protein VFY90_12030 [Tepidiformaceae bacterium]|nr:hypothetical protein [Tepidiformaceae bacterium]